MKNPLLLRNTGKLLELAQKQVHESGYVYAMGKSRSKVFNPSTERQPSREKINKQESIGYKVLWSKLVTQKSTLSSNRRVEQAQTVQNFKLCDQLAVSSLKCKRRELESALRSLQQSKQ